LTIRKVFGVFGILAVLVGGGFYAVRLHHSTTSLPYEFSKHQVYSAFLESSKGLGEQHLLIRNKSSEGDDPIVARFSISMPWRLISTSDQKAECAPDVDAIIDFSPVKFTDDGSTSNFEVAITDGHCSNNGIIKRVTMKNVAGEWWVEKIVDYASFNRHRH
jgi:hypothetical protein